jgi:hypothetical protein
MLPLMLATCSEVAHMTYFIFCLLPFIVALIDGLYGGSNWF